MVWSGVGDTGGLVGLIWTGVKVGRGVEVDIGVGDIYQRGVGVSVCTGGRTGEGVIIVSGGYNSSIAVCQSKPPVKANSLKRAAG